MPDIETYYTGEKYSVIERRILPLLATLLLMWSVLLWSLSRCGPIECLVLGIPLLLCSFIPISIYYFSMISLLVLLPGFFRTSVLLRLLLGVLAIHWLLLIPQWSSDTIHAMLSGAYALILVSFAGVYAKSKARFAL